MTARLSAGDLIGPTIELDDRPRTLRLPAGAAIFALRGEVWLTQEGHYDDVTLAAGRRYDVPDRAPIVVSATRGRAELYIAPPADARAVAAVDLHAFLRAQALRLRREESERLLAAALRRVRALAARVLARLRAPAGERSPHDATT
jgi:hypothetical protein